MKKHKPTPGPWFMQVNGRHRPEVCDAHGECIVEVHAINDLNDASNARLIATTPDLLAALKTLRERVTAFRHFEELPQHLKDALISADAIIAKAEGK